ncbi:hypothetical protein Tco_0037677, partial [Tanacetum coccineum]
RKLDIINRKRGAAANDKASPQANVVRVTRSAAAKHKASTQVSKLDIKKHVIKRKRGAAANDKSSPQAKMFLGILPLISNSIKKVQEDSDGMKGPNHDTPSNTNVQVEEPSNSSIRSSKRIRQMDSLIELSKMKSLSLRERFQAMDIITSNPRHVTIFWGKIDVLEKTGEVEFRTAMKSREVFE